MLEVLALAFVIGLGCHSLMVRLAGPGRITRCLLVSIASTIVTAWCFYLIEYVRAGEFPEPHPGVIFVAALAIAPSLVSGLILRERPVTGMRYPPGHCQLCGYDLMGNVSGTCPECGRQVKSDN